MAKILRKDEKRNQEQSRNTGEVNIWLFWIRIDQIMKFSSLRKTVKQAKNEFQGLGSLLTSNLWG
jgi:hypothetical protein